MPPLLIGLAALCVGVVAAYLAYVGLLQRHFQAEAEENITKIARHVSSVISCQVDASLKMLSTTSEIYAAMDPGTGAEYLRLSDERCGFDRLYIVRPDSADQIKGILPLEEALQGKPSVGAWRPDPHAPWRVLYAVPLYHLGESNGVLAADGSGQTLLDSLTAAGLDGGAWQIITSCGDYIVGSPPSAEWRYRNFFTALEAQERPEVLSQVSDDIAAEKSGICYFTAMDGVSRVLYYAPLDKGDWYLLCALPTSAAWERTQPLLLLAVGLTVVLALLFGAMLLFFLAFFQRGRRHIDQVAYTDRVTKGYNQTKFELEAARSIRSAPGGTYAMVSADIYQFELINDTFGTAAGDRVLRHVHDTLVAALQSGEVVARLSADTFLLLLRNPGEAALVGRLEQLVEQINAFNDSLEQKYYLPLNIGVYIVEDPNETIITIQDRASVARKKNGPMRANRLYAYTFYAEMERRRMLREREIDNRASTALENGEFLVYLQPKVAVESSRVVGAEALIRWLDPEQGLIPPDEFIPMFERNGFIIQLDRYVFEEACRLIRRWLDEGRALVPVAVNLSRVQLDDPDFLEVYRRILEKYDVPPEFLEIELTETAILEDMERGGPIIKGIHGLGMRCALDDFGSGYSSLNAIKDIPADILKLDKVFFDNDSLRGEWVVESVIGLARKLGMSMVAEGVEDARQVDFLREAHCDMIQGYVYAKPMPVEQFEALPEALPLSPSVKKRGRQGAPPAL